MKTYAIIDTPEKWPEGVLQTPESARYSVDRTKVVVKWTTDEAPLDLKDATPLFHAKDAARKPVGAGDIRDELAGAEWNPTGLRSP